MLSMKAAISRNPTVKFVLAVRADHPRWCEWLPSFFHIAGKPYSFASIRLLKIIFSLAAKAACNCLISDGFVRIRPVIIFLSEQLRNALPELLMAVYRLRQSGSRPLSPRRCSEVIKLFVH